MVGDRLRSFGTNDVYKLKTQIPFNGFQIIYVGDREGGALLGVMLMWWVKKNCIMEGNMCSLNLHNILFGIMLNSLLQKPNNTVQLLQFEF